MNATDITTAASGVATFLLPFGGVVLISTLLFIIWRTGSGYVVRRRIWRIAKGPEKISSAEIRRFFDDQDDLMAFRFETGMRVKSKKQAVNLICWLEITEEDVASVRRSGNYFDVENLDVKRPTRGVGYLVASAAALVCLGFIVLSGALSFERRVLFYVVDSGTPFVVPVEADAAFPFSPALLWDKRKRLAVDLCGNEESEGVPRSPFDLKDAEVICSLLQNEGAKEYVKKALFGQRVLLLTVTLMFGVLAYYPLIWLNSFNSAVHLFDRLQKKDPQLRLDI